MTVLLLALFFDPFRCLKPGFDNALAFLQRYHGFLRDLGPQVACPQVCLGRISVAYRARRRLRTFHWTAEENFESIVDPRSLSKAFRKPSKAFKSL